MRRRNQKIAKWAAMAGLVLALGPRAEANTTYTYTGNPFNQFVNTTDGGTNPYSTSDFIQVVLTTVNPLAPNLPFPTLLTSGVVSLQMTDGVSSDSLSQTTAIIVGTNGTGAINQWEIVSVTVSQTTGLQTVFGTSNFVQQNVQVALDLGAQCPTANTGCATTTGAGLVAGLNQNAPGTWSIAIQPNVTVTPSRAVLGQPLTVSVTVPGTPTPTGSVQLQVNGFSYGNAIPLVNGAAIINIPDPANKIPDPSLILPIIAGTGTAPCPTSNSVVIQYSGETNVYPPASSQPACVSVVPTLAISSNPAVYGQPVTLTSMVYNPMTPQQNITSVVFGWDDGTMSPQIPVNATTGQAQFQLPLPLAVGTHCCVMATAYSLQTSGQNLFIANSNSPNLVINKANTATGLALVQNGSNATLTATVAAVAPGAGTPTGPISFSGGGKVLGVAPVSGGAAMLGLANFSGTVTAAYGGDNNFNGSASSGVTVNPPPPPPPPPQPTAHLSLSSSLNPSMLGQAVTFSASVTVSGSTGTPGGSVQFLDGTASIGSAALSGGGASVTTSSLTVGSHAISAQYSGDGVFPGASASLGQVVNRLASTLTLNSSAAQVNAGQSVTLTAKVGPAASGGIPAPTGQVTFSAGGNSLGSAAISGGSASFTTGNLAAGTVQFSASYSGDSNYAASSATTMVTVLTGPLSITTKSLISGTVNVPYTASVAATGGTPPYKFTIGGLPSGLTGDSTGAITGTPTDGGNFNVSVQVSDNAGATASTTLTLNITGLAISATLPDGKQGNNYSGSASVSGGVPPYKLAISGLPPGLTPAFSGASATVSGQPTTAGSFTITVQATDSKGTTASKTFTVNIASTPLTSTVPSPIGGMAGQPYSQCVTVTGGSPPFTFSATLPAGLSIDSTTGCISGTPSVGGPVTINVTVTDSTGAKTNVTFTVTFALPALSLVNFTGLGNAADPGMQPSFGIALTDPYPVDVQGTLTLTFQPASADTREVTFAAGGRTLPFTIPANSKAAVFTIPTVALQTGTVAGSITITAMLQASGVDITPSPAPTKQIQVNAGPPVIVSVQATRTSSGFTVSINGYTSTREMTQAVFVFNPTAGANLQTTSLTLSVSSLFAPWLQSSQVMGSQFLFTQTFTVAGNLQAVASITVTLVNSQGSSKAVTAMIQ